MKATAIASLLLALTLPCLAQFAGATAAYRGHYFGILIPSPRCSNERLGMDIEIDSDGNLTGSVKDYDNAPVLDFAQSWPFFSRGKFRSDITEIGDYVKGSASKSGSLRGTAVIGGCKYSFVAYRRFKVAQ